MTINDRIGDKPNNLESSETSVPDPLPPSVSSVAGFEHRLGAERFIDVINNYVQYYAAGDTHTARAKRYDLKYFAEYLAEESGGIERLLVSDWTVQRTKDFIDSRLGSGEAPATVARRLATIKHFGRTLAERVPGYINPAREVKGPVLASTRPHGLNDSDILMLREAAENAHHERRSEFVALRDRFLLELLLATGLRADEVRLLTLGQVSEDLAWLKNVKTKGRRFRNVYVSSELRALFGTYLEERRAKMKEGFPSLNELSEQESSRYPVLVSFYGAKLGHPSSFGLSPKTVFNAIAAIGKRASAMSPTELPNLHPHKLRHTFAHGLLDTSKDVRLVAQALGHSDVRTTMRYTERTEDHIARAIELKSRGR